MSIATNTARYLYAWHTGNSLVAPKLGISAHKHDSSPDLLANYDRTISGQLQFNDDRQSVENMKVNFYIKDFFNFKHYVGCARTDANGNFRFHYDWKPSIFSRSQRLVIDLVQQRIPFAKLPAIKNEVSLQQINRDLSLTQKTNDLGKILVNYEDVSSDLTKEAFPIPSHRQPPRYFWKLFAAALPELPKRVLVATLGHWLHTSHVQKIYDLFGPSYAKRPVTVAELIEELLNHVSTTTPDTSKNNLVIWNANWDIYEFKDNNALPNVTVTCTKDSNNELTLASIAIKFRSDPIEMVFKPGDPKIGWAMYLARSTFAFKGEAERHLGEGHELAGLLAAEFFKYITPANPLYNPMEPHLGQLDFINWLGSKGVIFGPGSVLSMSALTTQAVADLIIQTVKDKADWQKYQPPMPVAKNHYLAKAEALHFGLLKSFFTDYIKTHREGIVNDWPAIYRWSEAMHAKIDTLPPLTKHSQKPSENDLANLAKFCAWLISKTTFIHWAAHSRQQALTDISQVSLGMKDKALDAKGDLDPYGNTTAADANMQLFISRVLLNFDGDSLFKNPYGDVNKELVELLKKHVGEYEGYDDILKMHLTTQI